MKRARVEQKLSDGERRAVATLVNEGSLALAAKRLSRSTNTVGTQLTRVKRKWGIKAEGNVGTVRLVIEYIRRHGLPS